MPEETTYVVNVSFNVDAESLYAAALKAREITSEPIYQPYVEVFSANDKPEIFDFEAIDQEQADYARTFTQHYCIAMLWANATTYRRNDDGDVTDYHGNVIDPEHATSEDDITVSFGDADIQPTNWQDHSETWALDAFDAASQASITEDCESFVRDNWPDLTAIESERNAEYCGHDFALTRNHHGAGFWDRGLGEIGERLTQSAQAYGESNAWWDGTDGKPIVLE